MLKRLSGLPLRLAKRLARKVQDQDAARYAGQHEHAPKGGHTKAIPEEELAPPEDVVRVDAPRGLILGVGSAQVEGMNIPMDELVIRLAEIPDRTDITVVGDSDEDALRAARFLLFRGFEPGRILVIT